MEDVDHDWPAVFQMRQLRDYKTWACKPYPRTTENLALFYTPKFGEQYPWALPLKWLENATHNPWYVTFGLWMSMFTYGMIFHFPPSPLYFLLGMGSWSLLEYVLHRFVFHNSFCNTHLPELTLLLHYNHHKVPHNLSRLSTPFVLSFPIAAVLWSFSHRCFGAADWSWKLGFVLAFIAYDLIHYAAHYALVARDFKSKLGWLARPFSTLQHHHLSHHALGERRFGFTSNVWDVLFQSD